MSSQNIPQSREITEKTDKLDTKHISSSHKNLLSKVRRTLENDNNGSSKSEILMFLKQKTELLPTKLNNILPSNSSPHPDNAERNRRIIEKVSQLTATSPEFLFTDQKESQTDHLFVPTIQFENISNIEFQEESIDRSKYPLFFNKSHFANRTSPQKSILTYPQKLSSPKITNDGTNLNIQFSRESPPPLLHLQTSSPPSIVHVQPASSSDVHYMNGRPESKLNHNIYHNFNIPHITESDGNEFHPVGDSNALTNSSRIEVSKHPGFHCPPHPDESITSFPNNDSERSIVCVKVDMDNSDKANPNLSNDNYLTGMARNNRHRAFAADDSNSNLTSTFHASNLKQNVDHSLKESTEDKHEANHSSSNKNAFEDNPNKNTMPNSEVNLPLDPIAHSALNGSTILSLKGGTARANNNENEIQIIFPLSIISTFNNGSNIPQSQLFPQNAEQFSKLDTNLSTLSANEKKIYFNSLEDKRHNVVSNGSNKDINDNNPVEHIPSSPSAASWAILTSNAPDDVHSQLDSPLRSHHQDQRTQIVQDSTMKNTTDNYNKQRKQQYKVGVLPRESIQLRKPHLDSTPFLIPHPENFVKVLKSTKGSLKSISAEMIHAKSDIKRMKTWVDSELSMLNGIVRQVFSSNNETLKVKSESEYLKLSLMYEYEKQKVIMREKEVENLKMEMESIRDLNSSLIQIKGEKLQLEKINEALMVRIESLENSLHQQQFELHGEAQGHDERNSFSRRSRTENNIKPYKSNCNDGDSASAHPVVGRVTKVQSFVHSHQQMDYNKNLKDRSGKLITFRNRFETGPCYDFNKFSTTSTHIPSLNHSRPTRRDSFDTNLPNTRELIAGSLVTPPVDSFALGNFDSSSVSDHSVSFALESVHMYQNNNAADFIKRPNTDDHDQIEKDWAGGIIGLIRSTEELIERNKDWLDIGAHRIPPLSNELNSNQAKGSAHQNLKKLATMLADASKTSASDRGFVKHLTQFEVEETLFGLGRLLSYLDKKIDYLVKRQEKSERVIKAVSSLDVATFSDLVDEELSSVSIPTIDEIEDCHNIEVLRKNSIDLSCECRKLQSKLLALRPCDLTLQKALNEGWIQLQKASQVGLEGALRSMTSFLKDVGVEEYASDTNKISNAPLPISEARPTEKLAILLRCIYGGISKTNSNSKMTSRSCPTVFQSLASEFELWDKTVMEEVDALRDETKIFEDLLSDVFGIWKMTRKLSQGSSPSQRKDGITSGIVSNDSIPGVHSLSLGDDSANTKKSIRGNNNNNSSREYLSNRNSIQKISEEIYDLHKNKEGLNEDVDDIDLMHMVMMDSFTRMGSEIETERSRGGLEGRRSSVAAVKRRNEALQHLKLLSPILGLQNNGGMQNLGREIETNGVFQSGASLYTPTSIAPASLIANVTTKNNLPMNIKIPHNEEIGHDVTNNLLRHENFKNKSVLFENDDDDFHNFLVSPPASPVANFESSRQEYVVPSTKSHGQIKQDNSISQLNRRDHELANDAVTIWRKKLQKNVKYLENDNAFLMESNHPSKPFTTPVKSTETHTAHFKSFQNNQDELPSDIDTNMDAETFKKFPIQSDINFSDKLKRSDKIKSQKNLQSNNPHLIENKSSPNKKIGKVSNPSPQTTVKSVKSPVKKSLDTKNASQTSSLLKQVVSKTLKEKPLTPSPRSSPSRTKNALNDKMILNKTVVSPKESKENKIEGKFDKNTDRGAHISSPIDRKTIKSSINRIASTSPFSSPSKSKLGKTIDSPPKTIKKSADKLSPISPIKREKIISNIIKDTKNIQKSSLMSESPSRRSTNSPKKNILSSKLVSSNNPNASSPLKTSKNASISSPERKNASKSKLTTSPLPQSPKAALPRKFKEESPVGASLDYSSMASDIDCNEYQQNFTSNKILSSYLYTHSSSNFDPNGCNYQLREIEIKSNQILEPRDRISSLSSSVIKHEKEDPLSRLHQTYGDDVEPSEVLIDPSIGSSSAFSDLSSCNDLGLSSGSYSSLIPISPIQNQKVKNNVSSDLGLSSLSASMKSNLFDSKQNSSSFSTSSKSFACRLIDLNRSPPPLSNNHESQNGMTILTKSVPDSYIPDSESSLSFINNSISTKLKAASSSSLSSSLLRPPPRILSKSVINGTAFETSSNSNQFSSKNSEGLIIIDNKVKIGSISSSSNYRLKSSIESSSNYEINSTF